MLFQADMVILYLLIYHYLAAMNDIPIHFLIIIALIILAVIAVFFNKSENQEDNKPNYRTLFILGVVWLPIGISTSNHAFTALGVIFMIIGMANKKKWRQEMKWKDLTIQQKKIKTGLMIVISLILVISVLYVLSKRLEWL